VDTDYQLNSPLAVKKWEKKLMKESLKKCLFTKWMGTNANSIIHVKTELNKGAGDRIRFGIRQQLQGAGVQGDATLEGNEEALVTYTQDLFIDQLRHATRSNGEMSEQRVTHNLREENYDALSDWWADRFETWLINQLAGNTLQTDVRYTGLQATTAPDTDHVIVANTTTIVEASLSDTTVCRFSLAMIDKARERAKLAVNTFRPVSVDGKELFVAVLHPYAITSLRQGTASSQWSDIHLAAIAARDESDNPIYSGAAGIYNQTIIFDSTRIPLISGSGGSSGGVYRNLFLGAQAACVAFGQKSGANTMSWVEKAFDYDNKLGVKAGCIGGAVKTRFNSSDFGVMVMSTFEKQG
jgi:N4-gp56 family major capsid protein